MLYATYTKCPAPVGRVGQANLDEIRSLPGVKHAFALQGNGQAAELRPGVAIVANSTWAAISAKRQLRVTWDESEAPRIAGAAPFKGHGNWPIRAAVRPWARRATRLERSGAPPKRRKLLYLSLSLPRAAGAPKLYGLVP